MHKSSGSFDVGPASVAAVLERVGENTAGKRSENACL